MVGLDKESRSRQRKGPDIRKPLVVLRHYDLDESQKAELQIWKKSIQTGVEKEEEEEHHLQEALTKNELGAGAAQVYIPTPDASKLLYNYDQLYYRPFHRPKTLIRFSAQLEDCIGCPYNLDEVDDEWLNSYNASIQMENLESNLSIDAFESLMAVLEKMVAEKPIGESPTLAEFEQATDSEIARTEAVAKARPAVYEHWKERSQARGGRTVRPTLRTEEESLNPETDPYVCFRKREIKQLRKTRKTDNQSLDKLQRLRREMEMARRLLELVAQREMLRKQVLSYEHAVFEQRVTVRKLKKKLGLPLDKDEPSPGKKREKSGYKLMIPIGKLRQAGKLSEGLQDSNRVDFYQPGLEYQEAYEVAKRQKLEDETNGWADVKEDPYIIPPPSYTNPGQQYWTADLPVTLESTLDRAPSSSVRISRGRRRVGRGGRVIFDRYTPRSDRTLVSNVPDFMYFDSDRSSDDGIIDNDDDSAWRREERWRHDNFSDDDDDDIVELDDSPSIMAYRAFYLGATTEAEYRNLVNQPTFKAQFFAAPSTPAERASHVPLPPPQVMKAPSATSLSGSSTTPQGLPQTPAAVAAQKARRGTSKGASTPQPDNQAHSNKVPTPSPQKRGSIKSGSQPPAESVDPRQQSVNAMLAEAQRRAQNTAMLIQQYKQTECYDLARII
ncbi:hypothetical protein SeMB42_g01632 [Synchytrium endobioticum]|uniref:Enhancer of polycomb-like protein n=1 Tax=Synchytrium endobioticum TaxID=286115 RepID=A0A507DI74_9FUNG|nr:hypothetical protein SeLEV6574_g00359 [Synchytrium endobioticum]TPX52138.1 hypothetical protein SeMB42_g01632 [Synchytrium endobioticum]